MKKIKRLDFGDDQFISCVTLDNEPIITINGENVEFQDLYDLVAWINEEIIGPFYIHICKPTEKRCEDYGTSQLPLPFGYNKPEPTVTIQATKGPSFEERSVGKPVGKVVLNTPQILATDGISIQDLSKVDGKISGA